MHSRGSVHFPSVLLFLLSMFFFFLFKMNLILHAAFFLFFLTMACSSSVSWIFYPLSQQMQSSEKNSPRRRLSQLFRRNRRDAVSVWMMIMDVLVSLLKRIKVFLLKFEQRRCWLPVRAVWWASCPVLPVLFIMMMTWDATKRLHNFFPIKAVNHTVVHSILSCKMPVI